VSNESAGIQFDPVDLRQPLLGRRFMMPTTTEDTDIVDFKEEGQSFLINQHLLHYLRTPECNRLCLRG
jgi:hypothetical protein